MAIGFPLLVTLVRRGDPTSSLVAWAVVELSSSSSEPLCLDLSFWVFKGLRKSWIRLMYCFLCKCDLNLWFRQVAVFIWRMWFTDIEWRISVKDPLWGFLSCCKTAERLKPWTLELSDSQPFSMVNIGYLGASLCFALACTVEVQEERTNRKNQTYDIQDLFVMSFSWMAFRSILHTCHTMIVAHIDILGPNLMFSFTWSLCHWFKEVWA